MKSRQLSSCTSPLEQRSESSSSAFRQISSSLSAGIALQHPSDWSATPADLPPLSLTHTHSLSHTQLPVLSHTYSHQHTNAPKNTPATPLDTSGALHACDTSVPMEILIRLGSLDGFQVDQGSFQCFRKSSFALFWPHQLVNSEIHGSRAQCAALALLPLSFLSFISSHSFFPAFLPCLCDAESLLSLQATPATVEVLSTNAWAFTALNCLSAQDAGMERGADRKLCLHPPASATTPP